jgi:hypothetical protein
MWTMATHTFYMLIFGHVLGFGKEHISCDVIIILGRTESHEQQFFVK